MSITARTLALTSMAFLLGACSTESIHVKVLRPAPVNLGQYDVIAIEPFEGNGGTELANELTVALQNTKNPLTGRVDFEVLDRREIDELLDDLMGRRGTDWDQDAMEILDRWRAAEILLKGTVHEYSVVEELSELEWVDPHGYTHVTQTRECAADVLVLIEATNTEGDTIFDSVEFREVLTDSTSAVDAQPDFIDHNSLLAAARRGVVNRYLRRVIPREEYVQVHLYTDGDFPELQMGNGFAKTGSWDEALESYNNALEHMQTAPESRYMGLFNRGIALSYTNRFDEARQSLKEAYALEQDSMILRELQNVDYREREFARLLEQGRKATPKPTR